MSALPDHAFWLRTLAVPALQLGVLFVVARLVATRLRSARHQRAVWLAAFAATGLLVGAVCSGADREIVAWFEPEPVSSREVRVRTNLAPDDAAGRPEPRGVAPVASVPDADGLAAGPAEGSPVWWPAWVWLAGLGGLATRQVLRRGAFVWWWRRRHSSAPPELRAQVEAVARRLGVAKPVRAIVSPALVGPIAFGVLRPTVGLPVDFAATRDARERDAMLAHELAHLEARDPLWLGVADLLATVLWWHPLVWWARRQLRAACETAADEASVLVEDGPILLANCLVALAARLPERRGFGRLGMAGFRSDLGRRVERLTRLSPDVVRRADRRSIAWGMAAGTLVTVGLALGVTAWAVPYRVGTHLTLLALAHAAMAPPAAPSPTPAGAGLTDAGEPPEPPTLRVPAVLPAQAPPEPDLAQPPDGAGTTAPSIRATGPGQASGEIREPLLTRTFRVNSRALAQNLTNLSSGEALGRLFAAAGVDFGGTNALAAFPGGADPADLSGPSRKVLFYSERTGMLLVRATAQDLEVVEHVLQAVNASPPQVVIEAKFVELTQADDRALGFDWFLGQTQIGTNAIAVARAPGAATNPAASGRFPGPTSAARVPDRRDTNGVHELRGDQLVWPGSAVTNVHNLRVTAALGATLTGVLTDPQFRGVRRALEQRAGVDMLSAPSVVTVSGRQAQVQVVDLRSIATGLNPAALVQPGAPPTTNVVPFTTAQIPVGPTLDVVPVVSADGRYIDLTVIPTVTEFLGYDPPPRGGKVRVWKDGKPESIDPPLPRFRVRQMQTQVRLETGQTLVLGGLVVEDTRLTKDKVPVLGDLPLAGGLFRHESKSTVKKNLIVFITATIVDPAGNAVPAPAPRPPLAPPVDQVEPATP